MNQFQRARELQAFHREQDRQRQLNFSKGPEPVTIVIAKSPDGRQEILGVVTDAVSRGTLLAAKAESHAGWEFFEKRSELWR